MGPGAEQRKQGEGLLDARRRALESGFVFSFAMRNGKSLESQRTQREAAKKSFCTFLVALNNS
jgi:predicted metal-binding protein